MQTGIALRWNAAMSYIILRLAAPLVSAGCGEVGKMYLFCADENRGSRLAKVTIKRMSPH